MPWLYALGIWLGVHALAGGLWFALRLPKVPRAVVLTFGGTICFAAPLLLPTDPLGPLILAAVTCPVMALKLIDLHVGATWWRARSLGLWLRWLPLPFVLVLRRHLEEPARPRADSARLLVRGLLEVAVGVWVLQHAGSWGLGPWLDHLVRVLALYAVAFDGGFVVVCATLRLLGIHAMDFARHPILSTTPADFWRRYNRPGGRFLYENVFKPAGGRRAPLRGTVLVFAANGLMHEALSFLFVREVLGYQLLFFACHAVVVALTFRIRPRGAGVWVGRVLTFLFVAGTGAWFLANLDAIRPGSIYPHGRPW